MHLSKEDHLLKVYCDALSKHYSNRKIQVTNNNMFFPNGLDNEPTSLNDLITMFKTFDDIIAYANKHSTYEYFSPQTFNKNSIDLCEHLYNQLSHSVMELAIHQGYKISFTCAWVGRTQIDLMNEQHSKRNANVVNVHIMFAIIDPITFNVMKCWCNGR